MVLNARLTPTAVSPDEVELSNVASSVELFDAVTETLPNGRAIDQRVLWMSDELAPLVHNAERAERAGVPAPFGERP